MTELLLLKDVKKKCSTIEEAAKELKERLNSVPETDVVIKTFGFVFILHVETAHPSHPKVQELASQHEGFYVQVIPKNS